MEWLITIFVLLVVGLVIYEDHTAHQRAAEYERDMNRYTQVPDEREGD